MIDQTPVMVKEIREMAQLITVTAYDEVVADSIRLGMTDLVIRNLPLPIPGSLSTPDRIVLIGRGRVVAGIDLKQLDEKSIQAYGDSVAIRLPRASILDVIMNPSDFETFSEQGDWTSEAVTRVKVKARDILTRRALEQDILGKADKRGKILLVDFLKASGFEKFIFVYQ